MNPSDVGRERLAASLRLLRVDSGLSTVKLAKRLGSSQSKVSKTERGDTLPDAGYVEQWAAMTGASSALRDELVSIAEAEAYQATELRRELAPGRRKLQKDIQRMEQSASTIRVFAPRVVVGLAQTRSYAAQMFRMGPEDRALRGY